MNSLNRDGENYLDLPDKERLKIINKALKEMKKSQEKLVRKADTLKAFKEALCGDDLTKLNKILNEDNN